MKRAPSNRFAAVVTGASGGLGRALIERLVQRDDLEKVYAVSRTLPKFENAKVSPLAVDVTETVSVACLSEALRRDEMEVSLLVQSAALLHDEAAGVWPEKRLEHLSAEALQQSFAVNAIGPALIAREIVPFLAKEGRSFIVNVSARVGSIEDNGLGGWYAYRASKAAQNQFTRTMAIELRRRHRGTTVVAYHPGTIDTGLSAPFRSTVDADVLKSPAEAADCLLNVIGNLDTSSTGKFFDWDGSEIPW